MKTFIHKTVAVIVVMLLIPFGRVSPASGFSIGDEREVGEKLLYAVRSTFPVLGDPDLHQYINRIGTQVVDVAGVQFFDYRFYIVESNQFNAFAAPSGLIFFYSKLIESMNSEDELVSVIAHEIGHVVKRHLASRMKKGTAINIAALGVALAALALGGGAATQTLLTGSLAAGQSAQLYFSREDETEADLLAYKWMQDLGRDTEGQKKMLQTMRRITRYRSGQIPQYLLTHPDPEARLDYVESLIEADKDGKHAHDETKDFDFLRFKYRIMSIAKDNNAARAYLSSRISDPRTSQFEVTMARYGLSQLNRQENNFEQALKQLDEVIKAFPGKNILLVDRGVLLYEMGEYQQAQELLEQAQHRDPTDMYALFNLAKVLDRLGEKQRAEQLFRAVSYEMPEYSTAYFELGRILAEQGKKLESRFYLGKYNLYEGQLKLAETNFKQIADSAQIDEVLRKESEEMLTLIERLKKD